MSRPRPEPRTFRSLLAALALLTGPAAAQYGTVQREQKIASRSGGLGLLGNDYRFGVSVADLGDFDGDGVHDIAVGAHRANLGGDERGAVYLLFLNPDGTVKARHEISSLAGGLLEPIDDHDRFGISICSLGDLDLDGTTDIAVGAYRDDDGVTNAGAVHILFLRPDGTVKDQRKISALSGGFSGTLALEDSFGWSVETIGDLDDDGVIDLAVGATRDNGADPDLAADFGALYILFLNVDGTVKSQAKIGAESPGLGPALRLRDRFGADVALLEDPDGDGVEDIAVGAFGDDPLKYGKVFVLHLQTDGSVKSFQEIGLNTGGFTGLLGKGDRFGVSLAADDFDGDGLYDIVVGAMGDDDGGADAGGVWVCLLSALGRARRIEKISPDFGGFSGPLSPGDNFGISCTTLGDLDRDGAVDLAVGAYQDDDGGFDQGAVWILFRSGTGLPVADFVSTPNHGEVPVTVTFSDRSSGQVSALQWDFGDGTGTSEASPVHLYETPGVFDVRLTVHSPQGSDTLLRHRAVVTREPVVPEADFSVTPETGVEPLTVVFMDRSTGSVSSWLWDFGDGLTSTLRNSKHLFADPGRYTVSLTVSGKAGTSNKTVVDAVRVQRPLPVADFLVGPALGLPPLAVSFSDLSSGEVTSWAWDFGDGTGTTHRHVQQVHGGWAPAHTYESPGSYDVTLTVRGPSGTDTLTRTAAVRVLEPLQAAFDVSSPGGIAPVTVSFLDRSRGEVTSFSWSFGDGFTSREQNPTHVFREGGAFPVQLTVTGQGKSETASATVEIGEPEPTARFSVSTAGGRAPLMVRFTDRSLGNITSWEWLFGDGQASAERNPAHVYNRPGIFTVRLRVTSAGGVDVTVRQDFIAVTPSLFPSLRSFQGTGAPPFRSK